jgi:hypothetical protein
VDLQDYTTYLKDLGRLSIARAGDRSDRRDARAASAEACDDGRGWTSTWTHCPPLTSRRFLRREG